MLPRVSFTAELLSLKHCPITSNSVIPVCKMESALEKLMLMEPSVLLQNMRKKKFRSKDSVANIKKSESVEFPVLVFHIFVNNTRNIGLIKTCRLVCKSWNDEACVALRLRSHVSLEEDDLERVQDFRNVLSNRGFGPLATLPSPFKNFHAVISSLSENIFTNFINLPSVIISKAHIIIRDDQASNPKKWEAFFEAKMAVAELAFDDTREECRSSFQISHKGKRLSIDDLCFLTCTHKKLMEFMLRHTNLETIDVTVYVLDSEMLLLMLTPGNLPLLQNLTILSNALTTAAWNFLGTCYLPSLRSLEMDVHHEHVALNIHQLSSLINNAAPTIEFIGVDFIRIKQLIVLPQLGRISIWHWEGDFGLFSPEMFPSLTDVELWISGYKLQNAFSPHKGVRTVGICIHTTEVQSYSSFLHILLEYLSRQFPGVTDFEVKLPGLNASIFSVIYDSFPALRSIWIRSPCNFSAMSGMTMDMVNTYMENGWCLDGIPRKPSVLRFAELKVLSLSSEVLVTSKMIAYCLSKIKSLKTLKFCWNEYLSAQEIRDCLGHLEKLQIIFEFPGENEDTMKQLREFLPNVRVLIED